MKQFFKNKAFILLLLLVFGLQEMPLTAQDISAARAGALGDTVTLTGIVTRAKGRLVYLQDSTAGIAAFTFSGGLRDSVENGDVMAGDELQVTGVLKEFRTFLEVDPVISFTKVSTGNALPDVQEVTLAELATNGAAYESELIRVNGIKVNQRGEWVASRNNLANNSMGDTINVRTPSSSDTDIAGERIPTVKFSFEGVTIPFDGTYQLSPIETTDIFVPDPTEGDFQLTILHNNDGESQLIDAGGSGDFGGAARFKTLIDLMRADAVGPTKGSITLSSGDNYLPGPEFDASLKRPEGSPLYDAVVIDSIGYDALCIGNHDFDFGPSILARLVSEVSVTQPPFLSANLDFSAEPELAALETAGRIAARTTVMVNGEEVGVVGATTPNLNFISSPGDVVVLQDVATEVQTEVDALIAEGVNKIILIAHLQGIGEDTTLIKSLSGIDVVIAGGGDELLANEDALLIPGDEEEVAGPYPLQVADADDNIVPIVTSVGNYKYIGRLIINFDSDGNLVSIDDSSNPLRVSGTDDDEVDSNAGLQASVIDSVVAAVAELEANIIGTTEVDLDGRRSSIRSIETNQGNLIADAFLWQANELAASLEEDTATVAIVNGGGIRNDNIITSGTQLSEKTTFDISPFGNFVSIVPNIPAEQFKLILENAYSRVDTSSGTGRFAQVSGFIVEYDVNETRVLFDRDGNITQEGSRIRNVILADGTRIVSDGKVVDGAPDVNIATANFLANGGDQYPYNGAPVTSVRVTDQQALLNYISGPLQGIVSAEDYPEGGEGRVRVTSSDIDFVLTILHNNDGESQLIDAGGSGEFGGAARFKTLVDELREEAMGEGKGVVMLSSGDNFLPGPEFNASLELPESAPLYDAIVLDSIGYDAICIGNHDFDFGPSVLARLIEDITVSQAPFLSANLDFSQEAELQALVDIDRIRSSVIVEKGGEQIGIVGITTPNLPFISSPGDVVVDGDVANIVQTEVDALSGQGVDKIILISHLQGVGEDTALAKSLTDVDIIIAGGGDELLANEGDELIPGDEIDGPYPLEVLDSDGNTVYVVTTAGNYKYLGRLVAEFDSVGKVLSVNLSSGPRVVKSTTESDPGLQASVIDSIVASVAALEANIIGSTEVDLDGRRSSIRSIETNQGNLIADGFLWQANELAADFGVEEADVALVNGGGIRNDNIITAGTNISERTTFDISPFGNFVSIVPAIPADQFKLILENAYSRVDTSAGGTGRFAQIAGFEVVYDTAGTRVFFDNDGNVTQEGNRILSVVLEDGTIIVENGEVVDGAPSVNIATANFLANGGDQYPFNGAPVTSLRITDQQTLFNYISGPLAGTIAAADYPEGGEDRIVRSARTSVSIDPSLANKLGLVVFPNPAQQYINVSYTLENTSRVEADVIDMTGRVVARIPVGTQRAGEQTITWNGKTVAGSMINNGMYFLRLNINDKIAVKRFSVMN